MNIALIGYGYWGEKLGRVIDSAQSVSLAYVCDLKDKALDEAQSRYPESIITRDYHEILKDKSVKLVVIATPSESHFQIAKESLEADKHIWVEKPMTTQVEQSETLLKLANSRDLQIHVDHTYLFSPEILKIKEMINNNELGKLSYFDSVRINLGAFQNDVNVIFDLAPHDLSILLFLIDEAPISVQAMGKCIANENLESIAYIHLEFASGFIAHCHINWLSPVKIRNIIIAGDKQMVTFDDTASSEKLKIYDKGVVCDEVDDENLKKIKFNYRYGATKSPFIPYEEPLLRELEFIIESISSNNYDNYSAKIGYEVVKIINSTITSLRNNSSKISLS